MSAGDGGAVGGSGGAGAGGGSFGGGGAGQGSAGRGGAGGGGPGQGGTADELVAAFSRWAAARRAEEAAGSRTRERWWRQQAAEAATLAGTLVDLAERAGEVAVTTTAGTVTGRLSAVGGDVAVLVGSGGTVLVAFSGIVTVRAPGTGPRRGRDGVASGDRTPPGAWNLLDALDTLAAERSPVRLGLAGGETVTGELLAVGADVLTVAAGPGGRVLVAVDAVETCTPR